MELSKASLILVLNFFWLGEPFNYKPNVNFNCHNSKTAIPAKSYIVNLDLPPLERWKHIAKNFDSKTIQKGIDRLVRETFTSADLTNVVEKIAGELDRYLQQPYADEIRGISQVSGIKIGDIVLANIIYDLTAYNQNGTIFDNDCTSIVAVNSDGYIIQGRNLDYSLPQFLRNLTIQINFQKHGKTVYTATTYQTYIGVITGTRHGAFSLSGNQRNSGSLWLNLLSALEGSQFTFFALRRILDESSDYLSAMNQLIHTPTIAPVYYIIGGIKPGEGALITRNGRDVAQVKRLGDDIADSWFLVETNYDPWTKPPKSDDRRDVAIGLMKKIGQTNMNFHQLYKVLSTPPVLNNQTSYTTLMSASNSSAYSTMIRYDAPC